MQTLTRTGIQIPDQLTDAFTYRSHLAAIAGAMESQGVIYLTGAESLRPAAGKSGRVWMSTDTGSLWWDTGGTWMLVNPAPPANAAAGTPSMRSLGTGATQAAAGSHAAQHAWNGADPLPAGPSAQLRRVSAMPDVSVPSGFAADVVWRNDGAQAYMVSGDATGIHLPTGGMWLFSARLDVNFEGTVGLGGSVEVTGQALFSPGNIPGIMVMAAVYAPVRVTLTLLNESPYAGTVGWNTVLNVVRVN